MLNAVRHIVLSIIRFFYKPFAKIIDEQTFRYLACGGSNVVLDTVLFYVSFHFILHQQPLAFFGHLMAAHRVAFAMAFAISCPIGFILSRYIVFPESNIGGRVQLFRYLLLVGVCLLLNYYIFNLFVSFWPQYTTAAKVVTTGIVAVFSYISQRTFTFKVKSSSVLDASEPEVTDIYP